MALMPSATASWSGITGTLADQTDLQTALDAKAASSHAHAISDVTALQTSLDGKSATGHNHDAAYEAKNANIQAHVASTHAPSDAQKNSDITKAEIEAKLIGEIATHTHAAGAGAPTDATYIVQTGHAGLSAEQILANLATGIVKVTTTTGVLSTAVADTDYAAAVHAARHQNAGADEMSVAGLSGLLADGQTPLTHATSHKSAGADAVKLDELAAPTDVTTLNASTSAHGLLPKLSNVATQYLDGTGAFSTPAGGSLTTLKKTANQTINGGAGVFVDITGLTFPVVNGVDYAFDFYITFRSAAGTTGWKAGVNCPAGTLDFWAGSDVIANGAAGVATHTERHNTVRDDMTLLITTITAGVDLNVRIRGRYLCTAAGTFAARFANELAANTDLVVQKGSWGFWF